MLEPSLLEQLHCPRHLLFTAYVQSNTIIDREAQGKSALVTVATSNPLVN